MPEALTAPELLTRLHDRAAFDCGVPALNDYLHKYALQNQKKGAARTYVCTRGQRIVGYYSLAFGSVRSEQAPHEISHGLGRYPIPILLLARLAIDQGEKGKGLGKGLLKDALLRAVQASHIAGLRAVLVHAKDQDAASFYRHFGFQPSPTAPLHLYLGLNDLTRF